MAALAAEQAENRVSHMWLGVMTCCFCDRHLAARVASAISIQVACCRLGLHHELEGRKREIGVDCVRPSIELTIAALITQMGWYAEWAQHLAAHGSCLGCRAGRGHDTDIQGGGGAAV